MSEIISDNKVSNLRKIFPQILLIFGLIVFSFAELDLLVASLRGLLVLSTGAFIIAGFCFVLAFIWIGLVFFFLAWILQISLTKKRKSWFIIALSTSSFVFILLYFYAEYYQVGEILGWLDVSSSGWEFSSNIDGWSQVKAVLFAAGLSLINFFIFIKVLESNKISRIYFICFFPLLLFLVFVSHSFLDSLPSTAKGKRNLVIITIDTLRADYLGCYGSTQVVTPNIDTLAREGFMFERAYSTTSLTGPSHASIFTSLYPRSHGVLHNCYRLDKKFTTLPEIFNNNGYKTAAIVHAFPLDPEFGLSEGFSNYISAYKESTFTLAFLRKIGLLSFIYKFPHHRGDHVVEIAEEWIFRHNNKPFFLWLHLFDPHSPYSPPRPFDRMTDPEYGGTYNGSMEQNKAIDKGDLVLAPQDVAHLHALYAGEVSYTDQIIGSITELLKKSGVESKTTLVITSDHGEELLDHEGNIGHAPYLYRSVCHVPLIFHNVDQERFSNHAIREPVRTIDIMPTLLEIFDLEMEESLQGISLLALFGGDTLLPQNIISETYMEDGSLYKLSLIQGEQHHILDVLDDKVETYDLLNDFDEMNNLGDSMDVPLEKFYEQMNEWKDNTPKTTPSEEHSLSPSEIERLKALGYLK
jgi:arylsulfatase A-like enzyme